MKKVKNLFKRFFIDRRGMETVEAVILILVAVGVATLVMTIAKGVITDKVHEAEQVIETQIVYEGFGD